VLGLAVGMRNVKSVAELARAMVPAEASGQKANQTGTVLAK
jgi:hypothetical protein